MFVFVFLIGKSLSFICYQLHRLDSSIRPTRSGFFCVCCEKWDFLAAIAVCFSLKIENFIHSLSTWFMIYTLRSETNQGFFTLFYIYSFHLLRSEQIEIVSYLLLQALDQPYLAWLHKDLWICIKIKTKKQQIVLIFSLLSRQIQIKPIRLFQNVTLIHRNTPSSDRCWVIRLIQYLRTRTA